MYEAKILPIAVPITIAAAGSVAKDLSLIILEPIMPLKKTVIADAVKEKICANKRIVKFLLNTFN